MDFKEYIERNRDQVYSKIMSYLPLKEPVDHYKIVREYSERKGNYRRPGLLMLSGELFGTQIDKLILPAAAMQLSEDWILIHDDVEDNSELRRGKPALHKLYGNEIAINAGDAAHLAMWRMLKDYSVQAGNVGDRVYDKFYDMLEYTVEGQYVETNFIYNTRSMKAATEDLYYRIASSKTCYYTVYGPMQIGGIVAGAGVGALNILKQIGEPAGTAFQIVDDILDMTGDEKTFGKKRYGDLYEGKLTLIMLNTYKNATSAEKEKIDRIYKKRREEKTQDEINTLVELSNKYGSIDYAKSVANKYGEAATNAAESSKGLIPDNAYTETMISAVQELYKRKV